MIKGKIIIVVTSLATVTNDIQLITNLLNKFHMYTTYKEGDNNTLSNYDDFKSILKAAVKDNRYKFFIYLNINSLHFKTSFKPEIF